MVKSVIMLTKSDSREDRQWMLKSPKNMMLFKKCLKAGHGSEGVRVSTETLYYIVLKMISFKKRKKFFLYSTMIM